MNQLLLTAFRGEKLDEAFERIGDQSPFDQMQALRGICPDLPSLKTQKNVAELSEKDLQQIMFQIQHKRQVSFNKRIDSILDVKDG